MMVLTRSFREIVAERAAREPEFREALLEEAVSLLVTGDVQTGKAMLRDLINATMGFEALARATGTPSKSLMRMFGPKGNPTANKLFAVLQAVQKSEGIELTVSAAR
ncbi:DNA-binding protein [Bosea sp. R86505]|uniref:helix-turn-helix domain-containing transcriptional regulator n=1 Tax=Bosea sp. R86505 TaxID=3101710 RepID=UPI00366D5AD5